MATAETIEMLGPAYWSNATNTKTVMVNAPQIPESIKVKTIKQNSAGKPTIIAPTVQKEMYTIPTSDILGYCLIGAAGLLVTFAVVVVVKAYRERKKEQRMLAA